MSQKDLIRVKRWSVVTQYWFPGLLLLGLAFVCGSQKSLTFALAGFLGCFLAAVSLGIEGWKRFNSSQNFQQKDV